MREPTVKQQMKYYRQTRARNQRYAMKKILIGAIFFVMISVIVGSARQTDQPSQQKPAAQQNEQRAATASRASQRSRTITGRVLDEGNQPIEDASIVTFPAGLVNSPQSATTAAKIRPASTDEQGKFALENVAPGAYMIVADVPGYVLAPDINEDKPEQKYYRPGDTVTLRMIKGGVITGTVTSSTGEPVIGVRVNPIRLRDLKNRPAHQTAFDIQREWKTDDRGVYRIYGLAPGAYIIATGGRGIIPLLTSAYDIDAPTYFPSATRDTAAEVIVHSGEELTGIDIRYRDSRGHMISGNVKGTAAASAMSVATVVLSDAATESFVGMAITPMAPGAHGFSFAAVPDGEYMVVATASDYTSASSPRRVVVKGGDVGGVELALAPYGSISGRVTLEPIEGAERKPECKDRRAASIEEAVVLARLDEKNKPKEQQPAGKGFSLFPFPIDSTPNNKGEFKVGMLEAARYHVEPRFPSEDWYVRSITLPADPPATQPKDAALNGVAVKAGDHLTGMSVTITEGAAGLRGRILPSSDAARLPDRLRVHLVPAEKEAADETLRFAEAAAQSDGLFALSNLQPGKYWILIRRGADEASTEAQPRPVAWDAEGRAKLRKEAEAANTAIDLQPCQRVSDYVLRYPSANRPGSKTAASKQP